MNLEQIFAEFIKKEKLSDEKLLLLVSGGVDSVVLLDIAKKNCDKKLIEVLHFNHNTRKNCIHDFTLVENLCKELEVKFHGEILPVIKKSDQENQWRKLRQQISRNLAEEIGAARILTAHHATDLVETMIFRLTKGCGPSGLSPFEVKNKPFWQVPKSELINYAKYNKLEWNEDETNKKLVHNRNLIRHKILPELRKINPNLEKVFVRESQIFAGITDYLDQKIWIPPNRKIDLVGFLSLPNIYQTEFLRKINNFPERPVEVKIVDQIKILKSYKKVKTKESHNSLSSSEINDCLRWLTNEPQGGSQKKLGNLLLKIEKGKIIW